MPGGFVGSFDQHTFQTPWCVFQDGSGSSPTTAPQTIPLPVPLVPEIHSSGHSKIKTTAGHTLGRRNSGQVQLTQRGSNPDGNASNAIAEYYRQRSDQLRYHAQLLSPPWSAAYLEAVTAHQSELSGKVRSIKTIPNFFHAVHDTHPRS